MVGNGLCPTEDRPCRKKWRLLSTSLGCSSHHQLTQMCPQLGDFLFTSQDQPLTFGLLPTPFHPPKYLSTGVSPTHCAYLFKKEICLKFLITHYKDINEHTFFFFLNKPGTSFKNSVEGPGGSVLCRKTLSYMIWMVVFTKL